MNRARQIELETTGCSLTREELREGWHFCPEWDFMIVNINDKRGEGAACTCDPWTEREIEAAFK